MNKQISPGSYLNHHLVFTHLINEGAFGQVWELKNVQTNELFACKFENRNNQQTSMITQEIMFLKQLQNYSQFPRLHFYARDSQRVYMVLEKLGPDLEAKKQKYYKLEKKKVFLLGIQMIEILESIIHRDIKPDNIAYNKQTLQINLFDFGLSKFMTPDSQPTKIKSLIGTTRYASYNALKGMEQSPKDDLESLFYTLVYLLEGRLPWDNKVFLQQQQKYMHIRRLKKPCRNSQWDHLPNCFIQLLKTAQSLKFLEKPDYEKLKEMFVNELPFDEVSSSQETIQNTIQNQERDKSSSAEKSICDEYNSVDEKIRNIQNFYIEMKKPSSPVKKMNKELDQDKFLKVQL